MESSNGMSQGQDNLSSPGLTSSASQPAPETQVQKTADERTFRQSEVNDIVKRAKHNAVEDYRRLQSEQPNYAQQKYGDVNSVSHQQNTTFNENDYRKIAAEEIQRHRDQWAREAQQQYDAENATRIVDNFLQKAFNPAKEKFQDFDKVVGDINYGKFTNVVNILSQYVDNPDEVLYELGKDRIKLASLESLAERSPQDAINHAQRLAQSLKENADARKVKFPNEPLSQMRPSNAGMDNGVLTVSDYRAKYRV